MNEPIFPEIDTSYWLLKDKAWVAERKAEWLTIEPRLKNDMHKPKKALTIIKRYFLTGVLPDFTKLAQWKGGYAHLDLLCFIWLHPSQDKSLLTKLRNDYIHSPLIGEMEAWQGIGGLLALGEITACYEWGSGEKEEARAATRMYTGQNELLFDILIGDLSKPSYPENGGSNWSVDKFRGEYRSLFDMTKWLCNKQLNYINEDCLFQYDNYLEYWYLSCAQINDEAPKVIKDMARAIDYIKLGLYRIHHFDIEKEDDTCRTRFVQKIRKILDEREFNAQIDEMWLQVKSGELQVDNAWGS